jgi:hypothetical protein
VWNLEKACFHSDTMLETSYGHIPGTPPVLVYERDETPPGEGGPVGSYIPTSADQPCPGDSAIWIRYLTTQKTILGKPIYLRNYYHGVYWQINVDSLATSQKTAFDALGTAWVAGITADGVTFRRAGPRGAVAQNHTTGQFITTRTLKHRGKRHRFDANQNFRWVLREPPTIE